LAGGHCFGQCADLIDFATVNWLLFPYGRPFNPFDIRDQQIIADGDLHAVSDGCNQLTGLPQSSCARSSSKNLEIIG